MPLRHRPGVSALVVGYYQFVADMLTPQGLRPRMADPRNLGNSVVPHQYGHETVVLITIMAGGVAW